MSDIMEHILGNVLNLDSRTKFGIINTFGITTINDLFYIDPRVDLQGEFFFTDKDDSDKGYYHSINNLNIRKIEILQSWFAFQTQSGHVTIDWLALDQATFHQYSLHLNVSRIIKTEETEPDDHPSWDKVLSPTSLPTNRELESFQRSIKRSPNDYNKFKDDSRHELKGTRF